MNQFFVYIASNKTNNIFYTGVTNNLEKRMHEHKNKLVEGLTPRLNVQKLLYTAAFSTPLHAILAEKRMKGLTKEKKLDLIKSTNPDLRDLLDK